MMLQSNGGVFTAANTKKSAYTENVRPSWKYDITMVWGD